MQMEEDRLQLCKAVATLSMKHTQSVHGADVSALRINYNQ